MKPFRFRLESVLGLRAMRENLARETYARAVRDRRAAEDALAAAHAQLEAETADYVAARLAPSFSPAEHGRRWPALLARQAECRELDHRRARAALAEDTELAAFLQAKRDHDLLKRLREKQADAHQQELIKQEELNVADFVTAHRFLRSLEAAH